MKKGLLTWTFLCLLAVSVFSHIFPLTANACSCAESPAVHEELDRSDAVFSGKVLSVKEKKQISGYRSKSVLFEVDRTWKGPETTQIMIATGLGGGDCGYDFKEGREYLIYAHESNMYGAKSLASIICSRTSELNDAQEDLSVLGKGHSPTEKVDLTAEQRGIPYVIWIVGIAVVIIIVATFFLYKKSGKNN